MAVVFAPFRMYRSGATGSLLLESGDYLLLESGDKLLLD